MAHHTLDLRLDILDCSRQKTFQLAGRSFFRRERCPLVLDGVLQQFDPDAKFCHVILRFMISVDCASATAVKVALKPEVYP
jgi:hypothetical protein